VRAGRLAFVAGLLLPPFALAALAQSPPPIDAVATSLTVFAGTASGLWRSRDWGASFQRATAAMSGSPLEGLGAVHSVRAQTPRVFVGADSGLLLSEDLGLTWKRLALEKKVLSVMSSRYPEADPTLFAGTPEGLYKSEDFGRSFRLAGLKDLAVTRMEWPGPALILATSGGLYVSNDSGRGFEGPARGLPPGEIRGIAPSSYYSVDPVAFVGAGLGVHLSKDGCRSFEPAGLSDRTVYDLYWLGPLLYAATDRGVFRTEDMGRSWLGLDQGFKGSALRMLFPLAPDQGSIIFVAGDAGLHRTSDGGINWQFSSGIGEPIAVLATFPPPDPIIKPPKR